VKPSRPAPRTPKARTSTAHAPLNLGALPTFLGFALRRAQLAVFASFAEELSRFHLRPTDFSVLLLIDKNPGIRATDICIALGLKKTNFVTLLRELMRRDLVKRAASTRDARTQKLYLTEVGQGLYERALTRHRAHEQAILQSLDADSAEQLIAQLNKLASGLPRHR
jgi:DNA-binding MarR family transcriptional regulator